MIKYYGYADDLGVFYEKQNRKMERMKKRFSKLFKIMDCAQWMIDIDVDETRFKNSGKMVISAQETEEILDKVETTAKKVVKDMKLKNLGNARAGAYIVKRLFKLVGIKYDLIKDTDNYCEYITYREFPGRCWDAVERMLKGSEELNEDIKFQMKREDDRTRYIIESNSGCYYPCLFELTRKFI